MVNTAYRVTTKVVMQWVGEHNWSSGWVILSVLAHQAHLAQSYSSLIFSAFNTYNCSWFHLKNKKNFSDWRWKHAEKWPMLMTFFLTAIAAITGNQPRNTALQSIQELLKHELNKIYQKNIMYLYPIIHSFWSQFSCVSWLEIVC